MQPRAEFAVAGDGGVRGAEAGELIGHHVFVGKHVEPAAGGKFRTVGGRDWGGRKTRVDIARVEADGGEGIVDKRGHGPYSCASVEDRGERLLVDVDGDGFTGAASADETFPLDNGDIVAIGDGVERGGKSGQACADDGQSWFGALMRTSDRTSQTRGINGGTSGGSSGHDYATPGLMLTSGGANAHSNEALARGCRQVGILDSGESAASQTVNFTFDGIGSAGISDEIA